MLVCVCVREQLACFYDFLCGTIGIEIEQQSELGHRVWCDELRGDQWMQGGGEVILPAQEGKESR